MRYRVIIIFIFLILNTIGYAQTYSDNQYEKHYRQLVKDFYKLLFKDKGSIKEFAEIYHYAEYERNKSKYVQEIKYGTTISDTVKSVLIKLIRCNYLKELTNNLQYYSIVDLVNNAKITSDGWSFGVLLELQISNKYSIYFDIDGDIPGSIERIYLKDGLELGGKVMNEYIDTLKRPGIINDKDGFTKLREKPDGKSKIAGQIKNNELIFYTPIGDSEWYPVYKFEVSEMIFVGYIHKSRIVNYQKFPVSIKKQVDKLRGGC